MRSVNLKSDILWPVVMRMGYDPVEDLFKADAAALERYINAWVRKCWDAADWPELSRIEGRTPTNHLVGYDDAVNKPPSWTAQASYNLSDVVVDPDDSTLVYISIQNANRNHALSDNAWWHIVQPWDPTRSYSGGNYVSDPGTGIVYQAQTRIGTGTVISESLLNPNAWLPVFTQEQPPPNFAPIGKVLKVYSVDPRIQDGPFDVPFKLLDTAIHVGFQHGTTVWIKFMSRPSRYSLTAWDTNVTYGLGDPAYDISSGSSFTSIRVANIGNPLTDPRSWVLTPFPYVIAEPVWRGVYSDALRDAGQSAKAEMEEKAALEELEFAIRRNLAPRYDVLTTQQTGVPRFQSAVAAGAT